MARALLACASALLAVAGQASSREWLERVQNSPRDKPTLLAALEFLQKSGESGVDSGQLSIELGQDFAVMGESVASRDAYLVLLRCDVPEELFPSRQREETVGLAECGASNWVPCRNLLKKSLSLGSGEREGYLRNILKRAEQEIQISTDSAKWIGSVVSKIQTDDDFATLLPFLSRAYSSEKPIVDVTEIRQAALDRVFKSGEVRELDLLQFLCNSDPTMNTGSESNPEMTAHQKQLLAALDRCQKSEALISVACYVARNRFPGLSNRERADAMERVIRKYEPLQLTSGQEKSSITNLVHGYEVVIDEFTYQEGYKERFDRAQEMLSKLGARPITQRYQIYPDGSVREIKGVNKPKYEFWDYPRNRIALTLSSVAIAGAIAVASTILKRRQFRHTGT